MPDLVAVVRRRGISVSKQQPRSSFDRARVGSALLAARGLRNGREAAAPLRSLLNGDVWELPRGEDFDIDIASMRAVASRAAKQAGKKLRTRATKDDGTEGLVIQAYVPGGSS